MPAGRYGKRFAFQIRDDGSVGAFRPGRILIQHEGRQDRLREAYDVLGLPPREVPIDALEGVEGAVLPESVPETVLQPHATIDENWGIIELPEPANDEPGDPGKQPREITAVAKLNASGVLAQLDNIYFVGTLGVRSAPNYAVPNYAVPNYAVPNYAVPNYAVPNYAVPNYAVPNYAVPNYAVGRDGFAHRQLASAAGDCEPLVPPAIPGNTARGARVPHQELPPVEAPPKLTEIHVLDVRPVIEPFADIQEDFVGTAGKAALIDRPGALLPEALKLDQVRATAANTAELEDEIEKLAAEYAIEPFSTGLGANVNPVGSDADRMTPDNWLDPATNHGTFIKGIIDRIVRPAGGGDDDGNGATAGPSPSFVRSWSVAGSMGDVSDSELVMAMGFIDSQEHVAGATRIMSLSIAGYPDVEEIEAKGGVDCLQQKVDSLITDGWKIVAAAGNDASCKPSRPASFDGVIAVGAYGPGGPAWFSNHGHWVDACAPGVEVVSDFPSPDISLELFDDMPIDDEFAHGYAAWSGTSFAAPFVAAILARWSLTKSVSWDEAVAELISDPDALSFPGYGTIVSFRPETRPFTPPTRRWV